MIQTLLTVALGGALGASGRYLVNVGLPRLLGHGFPYATMFVNVVGSFAMGVIVVVLAQKSVITSYSIHYTKLYDPRSTTPRS